SNGSYRTYYRCGYTGSAEQALDPVVASVAKCRYYSRLAGLPLYTKSGDGYGHALDVNTDDKCCSHCCHAGYPGLCALQYQEGKCRLPFLHGINTGWSYGQCYRPADHG